MTQEAWRPSEQPVAWPEFERLARQAGISLTHGEGQTAVGCANWVMLERFATLVAQAERERCAQVCISHGTGGSTYANAIRKAQP